MRCINHKECNSTECSHKASHPANDFCYDGNCRWAGDTCCVPQDRREKVTNLITGYVDPAYESLLVGQIMDVFKEA